MWRYQLPVCSWTSPSTIAAALPSAWNHSSVPLAGLEDHLRRQMRASRVQLTQSGTAALMLAIRAVAEVGDVIAMPAYGCADLATAAQGALVSVRLYDIEPSTLNVDMESLRSALEQGVTAVVVAHLYGVPVDVAEVKRLAHAYGVPVIEDAAQGFGARMNGMNTGSFGDMSVFSFGRGKGVNGGRGGALTISEHFNARFPERLAIPGNSSGGFGAVAMSMAMWLLGRPQVYRLPVELPVLRLGEMVIHDPPVPVRMASACASLALGSLARLSESIERRRWIAREYALAESRGSIQRLTVPATSEPSWLRYPVLAPSTQSPAPELGIVRGYPQTLLEQPHAQRLLLGKEVRMPGAERLRKELMTLPTHHFVSGKDLINLKRWLQNEPHSH